MNVPGTHKNPEGVFVLEIGSIRLLPSDLSTIEQITVSSTPNSGHLFHLVLHNKSKTAILVSHIEIVASRRISEGVSCLRPTPIIFRFSSALNVVSGGGDELKMEGGVTEISEGQEYALRAPAEILDDQCEHHQHLKLGVETGFSLPPTEFQTVNLIVPDVFIVEDTKGLDISNAKRDFATEMRRAHPKSPALGTIHFDQYPKWRLELTPNHEPKSIIAGEYVAGVDPLAQEHSGRNKSIVEGKKQ